MACCARRMTTRRKRVSCESTAEAAAKAMHTRQQPETALAGSACLLFVAGFRLAGERRLGRSQLVCCPASLTMSSWPGSRSVSWRSPCSPGVHGAAAAGVPPAYPAIVTAPFLLVVVSGKPVLRTLESAVQRAAVARLPAVAPVHAAWRRRRATTTLVAGRPCWQRAVDDPDGGDHFDRAIDLGQLRGTDWAAGILLTACTVLLALASGRVWTGYASRPDPPTASSASTPCRRAVAWRALTLALAH